MDMRQKIPESARATTEQRLEQARQLLQEGEPSLAELARAVGLSPAHLQRRFRARYGLSPAELLAQRKLATFKSALRAGSDVTDAVYAAGYGSPSRIYEQGAQRLGMTPATYRAGGAGIEIRWTLVETVLGLALVAATERGICAVEVGAAAAVLEQRLQREFPKARLQQVDAGRDEFLAPRLQAVGQRLQGRQANVDVDLIGSGFQQRVWEALMRIPAGQTRSYAELARAVGQPHASRAVARACASNRLAVVVPCHRIIRSDGSPGGYRWGLPLKQALLAREAAESAAAAVG